MISDALLKELQKNGIAYETEYDLKNASTFRIGGSCALALFPKNAEQIALAVSILDRDSTKLCIIGKGSDTLFADGYIDRPIIFTSRADKVSVSGEYITAESGAGLIALARRAANEGLSGLEFASGIPGSVGGALYMNAGAYGSCMADVTVKSRAFDRRNGSEITIMEHAFDYRDSIYKREPSLICLEATLRLSHGNADVINEKMRELSEQRKAKQPLEYPSAGSYFKRPDGDFAGRLIEACGLKGARIGGAEISEKHAGFIINRGDASFDDVMRLEELAKSKVLSEYGILLEREVEIVK